VEQQKNVYDCAMSEYFSIHPANPQRRMLERVSEIIRGGGVVVYPTDSSYALGSHLGDKEAAQRMRAIRGRTAEHELTLVCRDLSEIATYAKVENWAYRLLKSLTPGPYTFILRATHEVPKRFQHPKRRTIGLRVPDHAIAQALLSVLGEPIMSSTLQLPDEDLPLSDPDDIRERVLKRVDAIVDGGACGVEPTTVLDLSGGSVEVLRKGKGETAALGV
jgi:tRNA threonylcarbamoyl adenosine modification protein (Sua5/YciO/YrdC/YwlC family)